MGSFNKTCGLTNDVIREGDEIVFVLITGKNRHFSSSDSWSFWSPIPILLEGKYDSYGCAEEIKLYQSKKIVKDTTDIENALAKHLKERISGKENSYNKNRSELEKVLVMYDLSFVRISNSLAMAKGMLSAIEKVGDKAPADAISQLLETLNVKTIDELKEYIKKEENANRQEEIPIQWMMFKKEAFNKLMNNFGKGDKDKEHYITHLQKLRKSDFCNKNSSILKELTAVLLGTENYASKNTPMYTFNGIKKEPKNKEILADIEKIERSHIIDLSILNEYFSLLGIIFQPSMNVNSDISSYGHNEAYEMKKELLEMKPSLGIKLTKKP